ncbi:MAG: hypothetical protein L3J33_01300 [Rhodobacteraceae bacterium]|nr:hypothetical protein [Paracoccaceae bacterium]
MTQICQPAQQGVKIDLVTGLIGLALGVNFLLFLDPGDTNYGFGFRFGFLPVFLLGFAYLVALPANFGSRMFSALDISVFYLSMAAILGGLWFQSQNDLGFGQGFGRLGVLALTYFLAKGLFRQERLAILFRILFQRYIFLGGVFIFATLLMWRLGVFSGVNLANQNLFHEEVFLLAALPFLANSGQKARLILLIIAISAGLLTFKISGFIIALLVLLTAIFQTCKSRHWQPGIAGLFIAVAALVMLVFGAILMIGEQLPDGNVATRSITYALRLQQFGASPIVGNFFQMRSEIDVGWGFVVSHSDMLDILTGLGFVGFLAITAPFLALLAKAAPAKTNALAPKMLITGFLIVASVNPVLMNPNTAFLFWICVGYLSATHAKRGAPHG